jgi:hypothetical protein
MTSSVRETDAELRAAAARRLSEDPEVEVVREADETLAAKAAGEIEERA